MYPSQQEIQVPLLKALIASGGRAKPKALYPLVTNEFSQLTEQELSGRLPCGASRWPNRIQWVRQTLVERGEMASEGWGVWAITEKGR